MHIYTNVFTLVMTDEEKHLSREAIILVEVPMQTKGPSSLIGLSDEER
jgi:hypothetical protein